MTGARPASTTTPSIALMNRLTALAASIGVALCSPCALAQTTVQDHITHLGIDDGIITPDGRWGFVRENSVVTSARIYDLANGAELHRYTGNGPFSVSGVAQDAAACSNTRAAVMGSTLMLFDTTVLPALSVVADLPIGLFPRDLEFSPDGQWLAVRGGSMIASGGGLYVIDAASGVVAFQSPGEPLAQGSGSNPFDVDSVAVTDEYAVFTSVLAGPMPRTRVTIVELNPQGGGPPSLAFETGGAMGADQFGVPHDLALTPDGKFVAVRSELGVGGYDLSGPAPTQVFSKRLAGDPGPFGNSALDSIEATDTRIATISRQSNPAYPIGAQIDVFDRAGNRSFDRVFGDPHDLALDEAEQYLIVRTHSRLFLYDVAATTPGGPLILDDEVVPPTATHTSFGAGLDSVAIQGDRLVTLYRDGIFTEVLIHTFRSGQLELLGQHTMDDMPIDVAITPNGRKCVVAGLRSVDVLDMNTADLLLRNELFPNGWWPWCDGVELTSERALAWGNRAPNATGWLTVIDLFDSPVNYCSAGPNSAGVRSEIYATGSASLSANDLSLYAAGLPAQVPTQFFYGPAQVSLPMGDGTLCVGGGLARFGVGWSGAAGVSAIAVDNSNLPGAPITAGSTWNFQLYYRDVAAGGAGFNLTDGLSIPFVN